MRVCCTVITANPNKNDIPKNAIDYVHAISPLALHEFYYCVQGLSLYLYNLSQVPLVTGCMVELGLWLQGISIFFALF